ncbi:hypothetical protein K1T71_002024 [Dendrolimus kikuchii]|uniref:Uncharacterized protein n=1 Tax=Dendrolimus kikuchii TaxID=765133 RepID=A0ACC1DFJ3_9NEOP|nr:hypothetical protein K1T71_002024 [Dendrolimus kikuchii]
MKWLIISLFVFMGAFVAADKSNKRPIQFPKESLDNVLKVVDECTKDTGATTQAWEFVKESKYEDNKSFKDFLYCILVKTQYFATNGYPITDKLFELYKDEDGRDVIRQCVKSTTAEKPEDVTFLLYKCYLENAPVKLIF